MTIRGQFRYGNCEKAPYWTMIPMIVYTTVIYIFSNLLVGFIVRSISGGYLNIILKIRH